MVRRAVVIRCHSVRLRVGTPAQPYEDQRCAGATRADMHAFRSPGRYGAIFKGASRPCGELFVSRCQVIGGAVATTVSPITVNSCGVLRHWSSFPRFKFCQEPSRGLSDSLKVLSCALFVHDKQRSEKGMSWVTSVMSRVTKCL